MVMIESGKKRLEKDSMGTEEVSAEHFWGASTQRALRLFHIDNEPMPRPVIRAFGLQKRLAAMANEKLGCVPTDLAKVIAKVALEIAQGKLDDHFPLSVWQTGSATATHMNVNEVIANRANMLLGQPMGTKHPIHPNDHVNYGQSSNDTMPTVMHVATVLEIHKQLFPALGLLQKALQKKADQWREVMKVGRTHLQDAAPLTLGQEMGAFVESLGAAEGRILLATERLHALAQGGTAVGTGLNTHPQFAKIFAELMALETGFPFYAHPYPFVLLSQHQDMASLAMELMLLAGSLFKMGSDLRLLASGPRCGLGELVLPQHEPGSSIMPGKVNPTQIEALLMVCLDVKGLASSVAHSAFDGQLQLHVMKPLMVRNVLQSITLLSGAMDHLRLHVIEGLEVNRSQLAQNLEESLMLATALVPHIGYDKATEVAKKAAQEKCTLKQAALALGYVDDASFDAWVRPEDMLSPK